MKKRVYLALFLVVVLSPALFAGWSQMQRLTYRGYEINPQIIAENDTVHLAWFQLADSEKVSYRESVDGGQNWGDIIDLNAWGHHGSDVNLAKTAGQLLVSWFDYIPMGPINIAYTISENGLNWDAPAYIQGIGSQIGGPVATTVSGDSIYCVYYTYGQDSTGNIPFKFLYSSDMGQTWSNEQTIAYAVPFYCNGLLIKKCFGVLYVVWNAIPVPESTTWETQVVVSYDGGQTWSEKTFLSQNEGRPAQTACLSCNSLNGFLTVGWMDYNYPGYFHLRVTRNLGHSWGPERQAATNHYISDPAIESMGDTLWAAWVDHTFASNWQIGYSKSTDQGQSWSEPERMNNTTGLSMTPWVSYDHGKVHLVWQEDALSGQGSDLYYRRWNPGTDIDETPNPLSTGLLQCYPNPFNANTTINFQGMEGGEIQIYDIGGRLVRAFDIRGKSEGKVIWDATDGLGAGVATGIYIAKVESPKGSSFIKMVYLK